MAFEVASDGSRYFRSTDRVNRTRAREICEAVPGGQLAWPKTEPEANAMVGYKGIN